MTEAAGPDQRDVQARDSSVPERSLASAVPGQFRVNAEQAGQRLDRILAVVFPALSRTRAQMLVKTGRVHVDGKPAKPSHVLELGQEVALYAADPQQAAEPDIDAAGTAGETEPEHPAPTPQLNIVFEDDALLVIDKPAGLVVHPAPGHARGTLVDLLLTHLPELAQDSAPEQVTQRRPGIVHRLDKDTSGLMVVAKDARTHAALAAQMQAHEVVKRYLALVEGHMPASEGAIEAPIGRDPRQRQRMAIVRAGGREARTRFRVLDSHHGRSLLELELETGRTHQIRVHLAALGHPVVGDPVYGRHQRPMPPRQFLHAAHLEFAHPATGEWMAFDAPLPPDLAGFLAAWQA